MMIKRGKKGLKNIALFEIFLLVSMTFAFAVVMNAGMGGANPLSFLPNIGGSSNQKISNPSPPADFKGYKYVGDTKAGTHVFSPDGSREAMIDYNGKSVSESDVDFSKNGGSSGAGEGSGAAGTLGTGLMAAGTIFTLTQGIGSAMGWQKQQTMAVSVALAGGIAATTLSQAGFQMANNGKMGADGKPIPKGQGNWGISIAIGVVVALVLLYLLYKKSEIRIVKFNCLPFEPPLGGKNCEKCNNNPFQPCSEYRCKSLGQACQLLNPGTGKELCAWITKNDVKSPTIEAWKDALKPMGLSYTPNTNLRPNARGVKIISNTSQCLPAFTKLEFGVTINEPAQCKIDFNHTRSYDEMQYLFNDNYYLYNHSISFKLPGSLNGTLANNPELQNGKTTSTYVRCRDANGNFNVDEYTFTFCIDNSTDLTAPYIDHTSIPSGSPIRYNADSALVDVYIDEPATCKWSRIDKDYNSMENNMSCITSPESINNDFLYTCTANLTGIKNQDENRYYFRCKDLPDSEEKDRNVMMQSYQFSLRGTQPLIILRTAPNETIFGSTTVGNITLGVETAFGSNEGKAVCMFSPTNVNASYIMMYNTDSYLSSQDLYLAPGNYRYYFRCNDNAGNFAENSTSFTVFYDNQNPTITRVYKETPDSLKIITDEAAECAYSLTSCNFEISKSSSKFIESNPALLTSHYTPWKANSAFYIKCKDPRGNEPYPGQCSMIVRTTENTVTGA
jgi:hypothetical protein